MTDLKKQSNGGIWLTLLIGVLIGMLLIVLDVALLLKILFVAMGVFTVIVNISGLVLGIANFSTRIGKVTLLSSSISILMGILMIFKHSTLLMILLGVYMIILPLVEILLSKNKKKQLLAELPKMILGVVLIIVGPAGTLGVLFDVAGGLVIVLSVLFAVLTLIKKKHYSNKTGGRIFADTNGDGSIDTVFVDTTGDGRPDVGVNYNEKK